MKKVLITGGAGYIGSHVVKKFLLEGFDVVVFDNLSRGYLEALDVLKKYGKVDFVKGDLTVLEDIRNVFRLHDIGSVVSLAGLCSVSESFQNPSAYFQSNTVGSLNLLYAMEEVGVKNIVLASSCVFYGNPKINPVKEDTKANLISPYAKSKYFAEEALKTYKEAGKANYVVLRLFNVCGADPSGELGDSRKPSQLLVQNAVRGALGLQEFNLVCGALPTRDGSAIRDYVDVNDVANAFFLANRHLLNGGASETINIASGAGISVKEVVGKVGEVLGVKLNVTNGEVRNGEVTEVYANISRAKERLGWEPTVSLSGSIKSNKTWYINHPNGFLD